MNLIFVELQHGCSYTNEKRPDVEEQVEAVLDGHGIVYDKTEVWIAEERLYEVLYSMEVLNDGNEQEE